MLTFQQNSTASETRPIKAVSQSPMAMRPSKMHARSIVPIAAALAPANRDGLAHLLLGEPFALVDKFALHLSHERNRPAEAEKSEAQEAAHQFADLATWDGCSCRHVTGPVAPDRASTGKPMLNGSGNGRSNLPTSGSTIRKCRK